MSQPKIEDFVIGTKFETYKFQYIVTSRDDANEARIAVGLTEFTHPDDVVAFYCINVLSGAGYVWKKENLTALFDKLKSFNNTEIETKKTKFIEDKEKNLSEAFDNFDCPKCSQKTKAYIAHVNQALICTACNQATQISELKTLDCGHRGKRYRWYSAQAGIRSGCYDCRLREEAFDD